MNERQKELYTFLKEYPNQWVSKEEISYQLYANYPRCYEVSSEHNSRAFALIRQDIRAINRSDEVEKIIVSSKKGYKVATKKEAIRYIERRFKRDLKSLKLDWLLKKKCGLEGQITIDGEEIKPFIEVK